MSKASILLADDNPAILEHVRGVLEQEKQYRLVAAVLDGAAVLRECAREQPDVIVLDISMGELSGMDVASRLREGGCAS